MCRRLGIFRKEHDMAPGINVVRQWERMVVLRFGKFIELRHPGIRWLWPFINAGTRKVDLRERFITIPSQTAITRDNAPIDIDFLIYLRVIENEPQKSVIEVQDFIGAVQGVAITTLRAVIGDIALDDVLAKREQINDTLRVKLDEITVRWGVKVTSVEIREITPPRDIQAAMNRQMSAERERRAAVIEAEGSRVAAVTVAEGEKQAQILRAEGDRQAQILRAEAHQQAQVLEADGFAQAPRPHLHRRPNGRRQDDGPPVPGNPQEPRRQSLDEIHLPMEFTNLMQSVRGMFPGADSGDKGGA